MNEPWELGQIYQAWQQIHRAVVEAMKPATPHPLFLANRSSDGIVSRPRACQSARLADE